MTTPDPALPTERCGSRGPRIGEDVPYCGRKPGHSGPHQPGSDDGWDPVPTWTDLTDPALPTSEDGGGRTEDGAPRVLGGMPLISNEGLAKLFHEAYERLAPEFGYKTREASAVPWDRVPSDNRQLMVATAAAVLRELHSSIEWVASQARADGERAGAAKEQQRLARESRPARLSDIVGAEEAARLQRVDREHEEAAQRSPSWTYGPQTRHHRQRITR